MSLHPFQCAADIAIFALSGAVEQTKAVAQQTQPLRVDRHSAADTLDQEATRILALIRRFPRLANQLPGTPPSMLPVDVRSLTEFMTL
jgi:hypothetical protein